VICRLSPFRPRTRPGWLRKRRSADCSASGDASAPTRVRHERDRGGPFRCARWAQAVHGRVLFAMQERGSPPSGPYRKCARVVGDVLGQIPSHGDQALSMTPWMRMAADLLQRHPLLDGHATSARSMTSRQAANALHGESGLARSPTRACSTKSSSDTVRFCAEISTPYPAGAHRAAGPLLASCLLQRRTAIAVGMATSISAHNLAEVVEALIGPDPQPRAQR